jgi:hypothetical protein
MPPKKDKKKATDEKKATGKKETPTTPSTEPPPAAKKRPASKTLNGRVTSVANVGTGDQRTRVATVHSMDNPSLGALKMPLPQAVVGQAVTITFAADGITVKAKTPASA